MQIFISILIMELWCNFALLFTNDYSICDQRCVLMCVHCAHAVCTPYARTFWLETHTSQRATRHFASRTQKLHFSSFAFSFPRISAHTIFVCGCVCGKCKRIFVRLNKINKRWNRATIEHWTIQTTTTTNHMHKILARWSTVNGQHAIRWLL